MFAQPSASKSKADAIPRLAEKINDEDIGYLNEPLLYQSRFVNLILRLHQAISCFLIHCPSFQPRIDLILEHYCSETSSGRDPCIIRAQNPSGYSFSKMKSSNESSPIPQLCDVCVEIDFELIAPSMRLCNETRYAECIPGPREQPLGTAEEIFGRAIGCSFCALLTKSLQTHTDLDTAGKCYLMGGLSFCISCHQADFTRDGPHIHTMKAEIQFRPSEIFSWPALPWELDSHESHPQGVRNILEFQVDRRVAMAELEGRLPVITGRRVEPMIKMELLRKWLVTCEQSHIGRCPHSSNVPSWGATFRPAFMIDVKRCCVTRPPRDCRYIALSYVWGRGQMLKHLCDNSAILQTPGSLRDASVPKTIRDALTATEQIGERYLWVDALCIVQDDALMQQSQIAKMDQVYANALLTIVAANGDSAEAGLPGVGSSLRDPAQDITTLPKGILRTIICDTTEAGNYMKKTPWAQRAWTMQELLCSGRCLIFTTSQVYWRCQCAVWLEEISLEKTTSNNLEIFPSTGRDRFPDHKLNKYQYFQLFAKLLGNYMRRQLSFKADLVNAFSGICSRLSVIHDDTFFWGLPQSQFSRSLGWRLYSKHSRNHAQTRIVAASGVVEEVPFPTWSWAAWSSTGIDPWIIFILSDTWFSHADRPIDPERIDASGHEFMSAVDFWISDMSGQIVPIEEPGSHQRQDPDTQEAALNPAWRGGERGLPNNLANTATANAQRPGLLYFWTSVLSLDLANAEDRGLVPFMYKDGLEYNEIHYRDRQESIVDYIVVSRTDETRSESGKRNLVILVVEWRDEIAYRLGSGKVKEEYWLRIERREWKFVILG